MTERLYLTPAHKTTSTWALIEKHLKERLDLLRKQNDSQPSEAATQKLRGQIAEVKALLTIGEDPPVMDSQ